jgi:hypothetical protein
MFYALLSPFAIEARCGLEGVYKGFTEVFSVSSKFAELIFLLL